MEKPVGIPTESPPHILHLLVAYIFLTVYTVCQVSVTRFAQWRRLHRARGHVRPPPLLQMAGHTGHRE